MITIGDHRLKGIIRSVLDWTAVFLIPAAVGIATATVALIHDGREYKAERLGIRVIRDDLATLSVNQAVASLIKQRVVGFYETDRSEAPFWIQFSVPKTSAQDSILEFPIPHSMKVACWNAETLQLLGEANRDAVNGLVGMARGGFTLDIQAIKGASAVCRITSAGPSQMSVRLWDYKDFVSATRDFHRNSGLIDGGLGILALFVFVTAIINRQSIYVIYAAWLFGNLRLAGLGNGADTYWLGYPVPMRWLDLMHMVTMSGYYLLTVTLFSRVFSTELKQVGFLPLQWWIRWSSPFVLLMLVLSYQQYLPMLWIMAGIGSVSITILLIRLVFVTRSKVAVWFSLAFVVILFSTMNEVVAVAFGLTSLIGAANFVTSALFASLMASLAIAQQMRDEKLERLHAETALRNTYEEIPIGLFTLDRDGRILRANPGLQEMLGGIASDGSCLWSDVFGDEYWKRLSSEVRAGHAVEMELCDHHVPDAEKWFLLHAKATDHRIEGSLQDISDRVKATAKLRFLADHDPLTGIFNRRGIEKCLSEALTDKNSDLRCQLAYIDLDRFKLINDLYGHGTGDEVLRQICQRIQPNLIKSDFFGRVGGDEFVIIFRRSSLAEAADNCRQLIATIEGSPFIIDNKAFRVGGCIGLVEVGTDIETHDAVSNADRACREAKLGSGGQLVVYDKDSPAFNEREHELHILKRFGVDAAPDGLFLVMQPIMSLRSPYDSLNFEVLLRMYRPDNSIEPAWRVINTAEKHGRIALVDRWVLKTVLEWLDLNFDSLSKTRFVSVNLSGGSLNDERFIEDAFALVAQHPRSAGRLCFEITESVAVSDINNTLRFVNRVREFGAKVALDDFGVGYTSFSYLHSLSADILKIDGSLVSSALAHPANLSIIEAISNLTSNLGMTSIAEWAGDLDTVKAMVEVGIDYVQSYAVGRPQMPESILVAHSAADFIQDKQIEEYVRKCLVAGLREDMPIFGRRRGDLH